MSEKKHIDIIANTMVEPGLSGGNRIFIEIAKCWVKDKIEVDIYTSEVGKKICLGNGLSLANYYTWSLPKRYQNKKTLTRVDILLLYFWGMVRGSSVFFKRRKKQDKTTLWTTSDYWPDALIGIFAKWLCPNILWISSLFLFAPNPFIGFQENGSLSRPSIKNLAFYLSQRPIYLLTKIMADLVFVTSQPDMDRFVRIGKEPEKVIVIRGGVNTDSANDYFAQKKIDKKIYEACFVGRFHTQKGVLELIDIWTDVCRKKRKAKLVMIGDGELMPEVINKIKKNGLEKNIILKGFLGDGNEKFDVFKKSRIILHPAVYDSGGMAAAEAMAWGLPGISFDLAALKTYYPVGMLKVNIGDNKQFAKLIIRLLNDKELYYNTSVQARKLIVEHWNWLPKAEQLRNLIFKSK